VTRTTRNGKPGLELEDKIIGPWLKLHRGTAQQGEGEVVMTLHAGCAKSTAFRTDQDVAEASLLAAVRRGQPAACEDFVRRYSGQMLAVARRFLRCEQDADDAVQEAFLSAFRSVHRFAGDSRISTWLHRIVINACLMKLRSEKKRTSASIEHLLPAFDDTGHHAGRVTVWSDALQNLQTSELRARVRDGIGELPEPYRAVLLLRDLEEWTTQETAERLGLTEGTVKVRLHRARQALRTLLDPRLADAA
jgi:RNA polymerase sigma-70 factor (ECF subfamily)